MHPRRGGERDKRLVNESSMKNFGKLDVLALIAALFGAATIFSGGRALFGDEQARAAVGNAVWYVLWFNFVAGFAYVVAGVGLWVRAAWARTLAIGVAASTALVGIAFLAHVLQGGAYELRTAGALLLRFSFWTATAILICRTLPGTSSEAGGRANH
jgi:hypothetical protein